MKEFKVGDIAFTYCVDNERFYCVKVVKVGFWGVTAGDASVPDNEDQMYFMGPHDTFFQYFSDAYEAALAPVKERYTKLVDEYRAEINVICKAECKFVHGEGWGENDE